MRILVTDYVWPNLEVEERVLSEIGAELVVAPDGDEDTLVALADGCDGILTCWAQTTQKVIESALPTLKVIVRYGVGLDNIDVAFATQKGIPVANVPDYCFVDVAEHTMALLLSFSHKITRFDRHIRGGNWGIQAGLPLRRLTGQTLGLIGFGQIAREVVPRAKAFGLQVVAYSRSLTPETAAEYGVEAVDLNTLLETSDFVSVHCPSTDETRGMINADALGRMKVTACLINTSRGNVIDEEALLSALEKNTLAGAALDVRCQEPAEAGDRLIQMDQVIHTPHSAFYSTESLIELPEKAALEVRRVLKGESLVHLVNPEYEANR
ncbi:MAG: C-terminal binding protein [Candidatus Latescibacteria bacterium]|nr:C-terminal binding protein [Candidatus Latescibacterota bacterium]